MDSSLVPLADLLVLTTVAVVLLLSPGGLVHVVPRSRRRGSSAIVRRSAADARGAPGVRGSSSTGVFPASALESLEPLPGPGRWAGAAWVRRAETAGARSGLPCTAPR